MAGSVDNSIQQMNQAAADSEKVRDEAAAVIPVIVPNAMNSFWRIGEMV